MTLAIFHLAGPGSPPTPAWGSAPIAGVSALQRLLVAAAAAGIDTVHIVGERAASLPELGFRLPESDPRLPRVVAGAPEDRSTRVLELAAGRFPHPSLWTSVLAEPGSAEYVDAAGEPVGLRVWDAGSALGSPLPRRSLPAGLWVERLEAPGASERVLEALLAALVKPTDGWFARRFNRPLSLRLTRWLAPLGVGPDAMTAVALACGVGACVCSSRGSYGGFALGGLLYQAASVLDGVDGELARLKHLATRHGEWLDTVSDDATTVLYLAGVTAGVARSGGPPELVATGLVAIALVVVAVSYLYWRLLRIGASSLLALESTRESPELHALPAGRLIGRLQPLIKHDAYALGFMALALAGVAWLALPLTALAMILTILTFAGLALRRRWRASTVAARDA